LVNDGDMMPFAIVRNGRRGILIFDSQRSYEDRSVRVNRKGNGASRSIVIEKNHAARGIPTKLHPSLHRERGIVGVELQFGGRIIDDHILAVCELNGKIP